MPATERTAFTDKYRCEQPACSSDQTHVLAQIGATIRDPVLKLRYLRRALERQASGPIVRHLPGMAARRALYRWRGIAVLERVAGSDSAQAIAGIRARASGLLRRCRSQATACVSNEAWEWPGFAALRRVPSTKGAVALFLGPILIAGAAFGIGSKPSRTEMPVSTAAPSATSSIPALTPVAEPVVAEDHLQKPTTIWLADRGSGWELYSSGLRIETQHTVWGEQRSYRIHDRVAGLQPAVYTRPIGILFHVSESDHWPLESDYGRRLRRSTAGLVKYVKANESYNYLIDRFGRVYRIVDDDSRARHAGHSIWARGDEVYLDLNKAFLGVAFESRWEAGRVLPITAAQLNAGRNLTDYLRQRFAIPPEMCVTHGLTSVSPLQHLIGYHLDWARGFPFAAFGLPDLYAQAPPSVALFGFDYDERFLRDVGERWAGLDAAEEALSQRAAARGISVAELRMEGRATYRRWAQEVREPVSGSERVADKRG